MSESSEAALADDGLTAPMNDHLSTMKLKTSPVDSESPQVPVPEGVDDKVSKSKKRKTGRCKKKRCDSHEDCVSKHNNSVPDGNSSEESLENIDAKHVAPECAVDAKDKNLVELERPDHKPDKRKRKKSQRGGQKRRHNCPGDNNDNMSSSPIDSAVESKSKTSEPAAEKTSKSKKRKYRKEKTDLEALDYNDKVDNGKSKKVKRKKEKRDVVDAPVKAPLDRSALPGSENDQEPSSNNQRVSLAASPIQGVVEDRCLDLQAKEGSIVVMPRDEVAPFSFEDVVKGPMDGLNVEDSSCSQANCSSHIIRSTHLDQDAREDADNAKLAVVPSTVKEPRKKKLLVLDINGLLVDINQDYHNSHRADTKVSGKLVFNRPYCHDFLRFCLHNFNIGIWSSRRKHNVEYMVDYLFGDSKDKLLFSWDLSKCTSTGFQTIENQHKPLVLKELKKLWNKEDPELPWEKGEFSPSNTLLVDDSPYKALCNPPNTAIFPHPYKYWDRKDYSLGRGGNLRRYLEDLALADDVQCFVRRNRFGQQPITEANRDWEFYAQVVRSLGGPTWSA